MTRIYVIDDDRELLTVISALLEKRGFDVTTFFDWKTAFNSMMTLLPQLILLDVFMSGIDGLNVCQYLKASSFTRKIPVLMFSGFPQIAQTAVDDYGADDFIAKPFEIGDLVKKIQSIITKRTLPALI